MKYNLHRLIERYERKEKLKFLFFWGHQPKKDGSIGDNCLSQWWHAPFEVEGMKYNTAEHWMMVKKALLFEDRESAERILRCASPAEAKRLGRTVKGFDAKSWDERKGDIVVAGNLHKFSQHAALKKYLLSTGRKILVEASPVDKVWGIGMAKGDDPIENPTRWRGENQLGFALMEVRDKLPA